MCAGRRDYFDSDLDTHTLGCVKRYLNDKTRFAVQEFTLAGAKAYELHNIAWLGVRVRFLREILKVLFILLDLDLHNPTLGKRKVKMFFNCPCLLQGIGKNCSFTISH